MARRTKITALILPVLLLCLSISGPVSAGNKINVVVTVLPEAEFAEKVGGEHVKVSVMVPYGNNPHIYEPAPSQLRGLADAQLYFKLGSGIEFELTWMSKIASINKNLTIVNISEGIDLMADKDPHIWLSPRNAIIMVENIRDALIVEDFQNKEAYRKNAALYIKELESLDAEIKEKLTGKKNRVFMVFHPSLAYFARDYNLKEIAIESEGKEPTIADLKGIIDEARSSGARIILASPQFSQKSAEVVAEEINGKVVSVDPLSKNYIENMRHIADILKEGTE